jgi:hypothetical protein
MAARKTKARFRVVGRIDAAHSATVVIDEQAGLISVRPYRRRRDYVLPLVDVARLIVAKVVTAELAEKRRNGQRARTRSTRTRVTRGLLGASRVR